MMYEVSERIGLCNYAYKLIKNMHIYTYVSILSYAYTFIYLDGY